MMHHYSVNAQGARFMKEPDFDIAERAAFYLGKGFH